MRIFSNLFISRKDKERCSATLIKWNTFYQELTKEEQIKFVKRTFQFIGDSDFITEGNKQLSLEVKTIISGAFIQMTFGLKRFLLSQYNTIFVAPRAYSYKHTEDVYHGDVNTKSKRVTLSWPKVKEGFAIPDDAINLCIHELGHCLYIEQTERGRFFSDAAWKQWHLLALPIMRKLKSHKSNSLRSYGGNNELEFFSVSLETYFENPKGLEKEYPIYFKFLQKLLNLG